MSRPASFGRLLQSYRWNSIRLFSTATSPTLTSLGQNLKLKLTIDSEPYSFVFPEAESLGTVIKQIQNENSSTQVEFFVDDETRVAAVTPLSELLGKPVKISVNGQFHSLQSHSFADGSKQLQLDTVIRTVLYRNIRQRLKCHPSPEISVREFLQICAQEGVDEIRARKLLKNWTEIGILYYFPDQADCVILNPKQVVDAVRPYLHVGAQARREVEIKEDISQLERQREGLLKQRKDLESQAYSYANRMIYGGILALTSQMAVLARLTWWDLNWDIMEPITYFITFGTGVMGYAFYIVRKEEYTFFELRNIFFQRRLEKLLKTSGFPESKYKELSGRIEELKRQLT